MAPPVPDSLARRGDFRPCEPDALQGCYPQLPAMNRITQWCNRRILELRMKLDQLRQFKPTKPNRAAHARTSASQGRSRAGPLALFRRGRRVTPRDFYK